MLILAHASESVKPVVAAVRFDSARLDAPLARFGLGIQVESPRWNAPTAEAAAWEAGRTAGLEDGAPVAPARFSGFLADSWLDGWAEGSSVLSAREADYLRDLADAADSLLYGAYASEGR